MSAIMEALPADACGLRLCRMTRKDDLILYEAVTFPKGLTAVEKILRRATIAGRVEVNGENVDHWADVLIDPDTWTATVALDAGSFKYLKDKMRPRVDAK